MYDPNEHKFQKISPNDGTIDFYLRVGTLSDTSKKFLDFGAGRGSWFEDDNNSLRHSLRNMKGRFGEVIATDVDAIVITNQSSDNNVLMEGGRVPLEDQSVDVIVADYVLEHIPDVQAFTNEIERLLKPGGWFCARTPHKFCYVALLARIMDGPIEDYVMKFTQPDRKEMDIFPKTYNLNTMKEITSAFSGWNNASYLRRVDPAYYFGKKSVYMMFDFLHRIMPMVFSSNIFIFIQKR